MKNTEGIKEHRFKPGESGNPKGRPKGVNRSSFARFIKNCKDKEIKPVSKAEYMEAISFLLNCTEDEIREIEKDDSQPIALRLLIQDFTNKKQGAKMRADFRDWLFGKAGQIIEQKFEFKGNLIKKTNVADKYRDKLDAGGE